MVVSSEQHWNQIYERTPIDKLGWYQDHDEPSMELLHSLDINKDAVILDVGVGASTLIDDLLQEGYSAIHGFDISDVALAKLKERVGDQTVQLHVGDITDPTTPDRLPVCDIWHDRACFHFLREKEQQEAYINNLKAVLKPNGHLIMATFAPDGAEKCSGLDVQRSDEHDLQEVLGSGFQLVATQRYLYIQPSGGQRPYVYAMFKRIE